MRQRKQHSDDDAPFDCARERIAAGLLPRSRGVETINDVGGGGECVLCRSVINEEGSHVVIRWTAESGGEQSAALHPMCHGVWLVIAKRVRPQPPSTRRG